MSSNSIASIQEGEEWIARIELDMAFLERDIVAAQGVLSPIGIGSLRFSLEKSKEAIEQIKLEMMLYDE